MEVALLAAASLAFVLAGEPVRFDGDFFPHFTPNQIAATSPATRDGLIWWSMTQQGREIIAHLNAAEYEIVIVENEFETGAGRAPQPPIATLLAAGNRAVKKRYELILNPARFELPEGFQHITGPRTPSEVMAAAWAAEMLHIDYYARGISLPHHERADFQAEWRAVAEELGFPELMHPAPLPVRRVTRVLTRR